jgi:ATP/ADP translocase
MGLTYFFIERFVIKDPSMMEAKKEAKKKAKPENGLQMVLKNAYLQKIAIMVVAYAIIIFLVEQCWYDSIIRAYGSAAYTPVTAEVAKINSLMTIGLSLFSTIVLTKVRWAVRAMVPVIMIGFSAVGFFIFYLLGRSADAAGFLASSGLMTVAPIQLAVILGSFQNVSSRCTKYSIFDSTKEQLFSSSTDSDVKLQGKGAVDVAFGRTAKGSGALIVLGLLSIHSAYVSLTRHFFGDKKAQTTIVSDTNTVNAQKGKVASEALMRDVVDVAIQKDGTYKITIKDSKDIQHPDFDKVVNTEGQVTFIQKVERALDSGIEVNVDLNRVENTTKSEIPDIAPAIFVIVMVVVVLWSYAVITIAPMYEQNLLEARKAAGETDISEEAEEVNPFNKKTILQLALIAGLLCTFLYVWVSHNITKAVAGIDKSIVDEAALKKMQSYD